MHMILIDMGQFKSGDILNLGNSKFDIEDKSFLSSDYFILSEFDDDFGLGKNSFVINSPPDNIQIEVVDKLNNSLYIETAKNSDVINKTQTLTVSIHVYDRNVKGIGKLYILGTHNKKIVRYFSYINIDNIKSNKSKVRFYNRPQIEITPLLSYALKASTETNPKSISGSFYSYAKSPAKDFNVDTSQYDKNKIDYRIISYGSNFTDGVKNFNTQLNIYSIKDYSGNNVVISKQTSSIIIKDVINSTTIKLESPFIYKNSINNKNVIGEITSGSYNITYSDYVYNSASFSTASYQTESVDLSGKIKFKQYSVAEVTYRNLDTFSGTVNRHKLYKRSLNIAGDYSLVADEIFADYEILRDYNSPIKTYERIGNFYNQFHISNYWFSSSNNFSLVQDSSIYINGMNISGTFSNDFIMAKLTTSGSYRNTTYIPFDQSQYNNQGGESYDCNFIKLLKDTNYVLSFNCNLIEKDPSLTSTLGFYLTSSLAIASNEVSLNPKYGIQLGELLIDEPIKSKNYENKLEFKFTPKNDLYGTLIIVPDKVKQITISDLSIKTEKSNGFSPNSYTSRTLFPISIPNELFDIKSELYDNNSNLIYSNLRTSRNFDVSGSSTPVSVTTGNTLNLDTLGVNNLYITSSFKVQQPSSTNTDSAYPFTKYFLVINASGVVEKFALVLNSNVIP